VASFTVAKCKHATLSATVVDTITFSEGVPHVEVINRTGTSEIYVRVGTSLAATTDPAVGGDDCYVVPAVVGSYTIPMPEGPAVVKLVSSGAMAYSVIAGVA
jgi:hypothetical protein